MAEVQDAQGDRIAPGGSGRDATKAARDRRGLALLWMALALVLVTLALASALVYARGSG